MNKPALEDVVDLIRTEHGEKAWTAVYRKVRSEDRSEEGGFYCAFVDSGHSPKMAESTWDLMLGQGGPTFISEYSFGEEVTSYHERSDDGYRRLVLWRDFHGRKANYLEIAEEFRLFLNLYHDANRSKYFDFDEAGEEVEVVRMSDSEVLVRTSYLRSFMAATQRDLLLFFEVTRHAKDGTGFADEHRSATLAFTRYSGSSYIKGYDVFTRLRGKKLIRCGPVESCGIPPFDKPREFEDFIIAGELDNPRSFSCDPRNLSDYFGGDQGAPHSLTPVFFRREVMQKYYHALSEYEIDDGYLSKRGAWCIRIDNNAADHVCVFLGDLGRDLPNAEQKYWRSFNIVPDGHKLSETTYQRSMEGNFFDPSSPDLKFKDAFQTLRRAWREKYGWNLMLPLADKDKHFFGSIRSMLTNGQSEFDAMILAMAKVTIDSIDQVNLRAFVDCTDSERKPLDLMGDLFGKLSLADPVGSKTFLQGIQGIRSTGVAHRKGSNYEKTVSRLGINEENYRAEFDGMLNRMTELFAEITSKLA